MISFTKRAARPYLEAQTGTKRLATLARISRSHFGAELPLRLKRNAVKRKAEDV